MNAHHPFQNLQHANLVSSSALLTTAIRTSAVVDARVVTASLVERVPIMPWPATLVVFCATTLVAVVATRFVVRRYIRFVACV